MLSLVVQLLELSNKVYVRKNYREVIFTTELIDMLLKWEMRDY